MRDDRQLNLLSSIPNCANDLMTYMTKKEMTIIVRDQFSLRVRLMCN